VATSTAICSTPLGVAAISTSGTECCPVGDPDAKWQGTADVLVWVAMPGWVVLGTSLLACFAVAVMEPYSVAQNANMRMRIRTAYDRWRWA